VDQNLRVAPYYGIPAGNPFESAVDGVKDEIWAKGLRSPRMFRPPEAEPWRCSPSPS
jgi:hypothetical protein